MILGTFQKQPAETLDYDVDYSRWLVSGDSIESCISITDSGTPAVAGLSLVVLSTFVTASGVKVWVNSGTSGVTYKVTITATTADGRIKQDELRIKVKEV